MSNTKTETFSKASIEKAFKENGIKFPLKDFIKSLRDKEKPKQTKKKVVKKKSNFKTIEIYNENIHPALENNNTIQEFLEEKIDNGEGYYDMFYDSNGLSDDGADDVEYHKVGDKIYEVSLHCEAEWVPDYSVRKNLPGDVSITEIKEITDFKIIKKESYCLRIQIKK